ncbi:organic solute transporter Ostalpha-domain-containing protein [Rhizoctonia solani]|nr:organic solute transporter Ostalpha-domain-containing protein [Rhizoctonia solani]
MYGLILFYKLTNKEIREQRPLLKFVIIKGVIFFTIIQDLVFKSLHSSGTIKPTESWSGTEVADGLNAFLLTIEMALASVVMLASEYSDPERSRGTAAQAIVDSWNFGDFFSDMKHSLLFLCRRPQIIPHNSSQEPLNYKEPGVGGTIVNDTSFKEGNPGVSPKNETSVTVSPV